MISSGFYKFVAYYSVHEAVLKLLRNHPDGLNVKTIKDAVGRNHVVVKAILKDLEQAGFVKERKVGIAWVYEPTKVR